MSLKFVFFSWIVFLFAHLSSGVIVCPTFSDYFFSGSNKKCYDNPDGDAAEPAEIIRRHGFNCKTYSLKTDDGYILNVARIHEKIEKKTPIIIGPGISMNSLAFINRGNKSLAFFLANHGYQVWVINWRDTRFSRKHDNSSDRTYWNTGFHKMATSDLKVVLKNVYEETGNKGIYVGYSMGTTIGLIFNIKEQEFAENTVKGMVHLAPISRMDNSKSILIFLSPLWPLIRPFLKKINTNNEIPYRRKRLICGSNPFQVVFCELLNVPVFGNAFKFLDPLTYPITSKQNRDSISITTIEHYHQIMKSRSFREFDFGKIVNLKTYNKEEPPQYDLNKVTVPQTMLVGGRDIVATKKDAKNLYDLLPEKSKCGYLILEEYGHRDFIIAKNIEDVLFGKVLSRINYIEEGKCDVIK